MDSNKETELKDVSRILEETLQAENDVKLPSGCDGVSAIAEKPALWISLIPRSTE